MSTPTSKAMTLLSAYEELTRKETVCLNEENWEPLLKTQTKKAKLAEGITQHTAELLPEERSQFNARIASLQLQDAENSKTLAAKIKDNRDLYKQITQRTKSGGKAIRAYGQPEGAPERKTSLTDRA